MARVYNFVFCDEAINDPNSGRVNYNGVLQSFPLKYVPGTFSFAVAFFVDSFDFSNAHKLKIVFMTPDNSTVITEVLMDMPPIPDDLSKKPHPAYNVVTNFRNTDIKSAGQYIVDIEFDQKSIFTTYIDVVKAE